jgi:ferredoxin-NADP reductase
MITQNENNEIKRVRVESITHVAEGIVELELKDTTGAALPDWDAGAHIDVILGQDLVRQYSVLGGGDSAQSYKIAVLREPTSRGGSERVHQLVIGDEVEIRGPRNQFALSPAPSYSFIAGGIGITPILPMIKAAEAQGTQWTLAYGGRRRDTMAYADDLRAQYGSRVTLYPFDEVGHIPLDTVMNGNSDGTLTYCCGPEPLLHAVEAQATDWPDGVLHLERFAPKEIVTDGPDKPVEVYLAQSDITLQVPADRSILDVIAEAGIDVLTSCQEGTCGTCETFVLEGTPDHRDSVLTASEQAEGKTMLVCVSRALSDRLVLDL